MKLLRDSGLWDSRPLIGHVGAHLEVQLTVQCIFFAFQIDSTDKKINLKFFLILLPATRKGKIFERPKHHEKRY